MAGIAERLPAGNVMLESGRTETVARFDIAEIRSLPVAKKFLIVLLLLFIAKQAISIFIFPPFSGHDEVVHYSYIRTVATQYRVPRIVDLDEFRSKISSGGASAGDFIDDDLYPYCRYVLDWYCDLTSARWVKDPPHIVSVGTSYYPSGWQYAANHPPLYYLLMAPIYKATTHLSLQSQLYFFRAAAIPFGMLIIVLAYALTRLVFPDDRFLAITVPAFVAFQPQISYEAVMVNNDIAGIASFSLILYLLIFGLKRGFTYRLCGLIGLSVGFGLLLKSTALTTLPLIAMAIILGSGLRCFRLWIPKGATVGIVAGLVCWPWYLFLYRTYGNFSGLDQIAENQWAWTYRNQTKPTLFDLLFNSNFAVFRWRETWGEFGWRLIHLSDGLLWVIGVPCILATLGLLVYLGAIGWSWRPSRIHEGGLDNVAALDSWQVKSIALIAVAGLVAYGAMLQFGTRFVLTQARYFFPAINAFAFLLMLGLRTILPGSWRRYGQGAVVGALILMNVVIFSQYVIPYWYLRS